MIQFKKMSRTAVSAAVLCTLGFAANAGTISVSAVKNVAQESFGTGYTNTVVTTANFGYQFSTPGGIVINPGGVIYISLTPSVGKFTASGSVTIPTGTGGALTGATSFNTTTGVMSIALTNGTGSGNSVIGVGGIVSVTSVTIAGAGATLAAGTAVTATGSVGVNAGGSELETANTPVSFLTSSQAVSVTAAPSTSEVAKIDVTTTVTTNIGKVLTGAIAGGNFETLGTVTFTNASTAAYELATTNAVNLGNTSAYPATATPVTYTLNLASGTFSAGATYSLGVAGCNSGTTIASTQAPSTITAATTSVTLSSVAVPVAGQDIYVCGFFPGTAAIAPYKATVSAVLTASTANKYVGETLAATGLYDLGYNGASVTVRNYIPAAVTGYIQTVRLINTGSSPATAFISMIDDATGMATVPVSIGSAIAVGGAQRYTQAQIEAAVGTLAASKRPRLRFTAATGSMEVQTFFNNANGAYTNLVGQDSN